MSNIRITSKRKKIFHKYFKTLSYIEKAQGQNLDALEHALRKETGIDDLRFFYVDGEIVGIGTPSCPDKMKLFQRPANEDTSL